MKKLNTKLNYTLVILVTVFFISCTAEGPPGIDGKDGNANVVTATFNNSSFKNGFNVFTIKAIDDGIVNYGAVIAYMKPSGTSTYFALPYSFNTNKVEVYTIKVGEISLRANYNSKTEVDFKFVIIGGHPDSASTNTKSNITSNLEQNDIDVNDYNQVAKYYNLED